MDGEGERWMECRWCDGQRYGGEVKGAELGMGLWSWGVEGGGWCSGSGVAGG